MTGKYIYLLKSTKNPQKKYIGITSNLKKRLKEHNSRKSHHTSRFAPWKLLTAIYFEDEKKAEKFEIYLKSGSGHAFSKKHF